VRLAIFGGTFDPIHNAHLAIARVAADRFGLDRVLFVPAAAPPHKGGVTHAAYLPRVRMAELACATDARFEVSRLEEGTARSYSIDTIDQVRARLSPEDELFFIIGSDAFAEIQTWRRWQEVVQKVHFLVVSRPGHSYSAPAGVAFDAIDTIDLPVSSSEIRRALAAGQSSPDIPEGVVQYIRQHHLYSD
jgi:nicotinate-nucleotide adenylyltransferase